jgi:Family of unknown function (DUF5989)
MLFVRGLRCGLFLVREFVLYSAVHRVWWLVPLTLVLVLFAFLIAAAQAVAPFIYTLF